MSFDVVRALIARGERGLPLVSSHGRLALPFLSFYYGGEEASSGFRVLWGPGVGSCPGLILYVVAAVFPRRIAPMPTPTSRNSLAD